MFYCLNSELRFYGCCHPCLRLVQCLFCIEPELKLLKINIKAVTSKSVGQINLLLLPMNDSNQWEILYYLLMDILLLGHCTEFSCTLIK